MSSAHQYDSLGRIMSLGGEIRLGVGLSLGYSASKISALFVGRLGNVSPVDRESLLDFAQSGADAAEQISGTGFDDDAMLGVIPVNPNLWGDNPDGRRVLYVGQFFVGGMDSPIQRRLESPDGLTWDQLAEWLAQEAYDYLDKNYEAPTVILPVESEQITTALLFAERRF